jgi:uncharacterized membrane protein
MILPMVKFLHLISGTTFLGITIAAFFYIVRSLDKGDRTVIDYSVKASYFGDAVILGCIVIQFITAATLVSSGHFKLVPWIIIAHGAFGSLILLWLANVGIKFFYFSKREISPYAVKSFWLFNIAMILIFFIIIHDAVTQSTWFDFLFRLW